MKMFFLFILFYLTLNTESFCQVEELIPANWKIALKIESDFNSDGVADLFAIVDSMDTKNTWQCAKRVLMIFHGRQNGFFLKDMNSLIFLDQNRLVDSDMIYLSTKDNKVNLGIADMNLGGGYNGRSGYTFRFQNGKWIAIGCSFLGSRATTSENNQQVMEEESFSCNFSTGKYERTIKLDSKITNNKTKKKEVQLYFFSQYNGDCN